MPAEDEVMYNKVYNANAPKRCLSCGTVMPNTPVRNKPPTRSYCSLKCRPKSPRDIHKSVHRVSMLTVGDMVEDLPSGFVWFVTCVEPRADGKRVVTLERYEGA
jgi:hypothetical protein